MKRYTRIIAALFMVAAITLWGQSGYGVVIFSNFGDGDSYDTTEGLLIASADSSLGGKSTVGFAFTTADNGAIAFESASLAVALMEGENALDVTLSEDSGNNPGAPIETIQFIDRMSSEQTGSIISASSLLNPVLSPTTQYWLLASTSGANTIIRWFFNDTGDTGLSATQFGEGDLAVTTSTRGVFRIIPEPSSLLLLAIGFAVFAGLRKKHA